MGVRVVVAVVVIMVMSTVVPAIGRVMGVSVKGTLQQEHEKESPQRPAGGRLDVATQGEAGVGKEVEHADAQKHAAGEREEYLHRPVAEREERDR